MKKRLLSAALALAMVLTLLPVSAFAATETNPETAVNPDQGDGKTTVTYYPDAAAATTSSSGHGAGWYWYETASGTGYTQYHKVNSGVITGTTTSGTWYQNLNYAANANSGSSFTLLGTDSSVSSWNLTSSLTIKLNGQQLTSNFTIPQEWNNGTSNVTNSCNQLTITDTAKTDGTPNGSFSGSITVGSATSGKSGMTVDLTNIKMTGDVTVNHVGAATVNVTNSQVTGKVEMVGVPAASSTTTTGGTVNISGSNSIVSKEVHVHGAAGMTISYGSVKVTDGQVGSWVGVNSTNNAEITLSNAKVSGNVAIYGYASNVNATSSTMNKITIFGHNGTGLTEAQKRDLAAPKVVLTGLNASAVTIEGVAGTEALIKPYEVEVSNNAYVTSTIDLDNANIKVDGGHVTGKTSLDNGSITVNSSDRLRASMGDIDMGSTGSGSMTFKITGDHAVINGPITEVSGNEKYITLDIPSEYTNHVNKIATSNGANSKIIEGTVKGGEFGNQVDSKYLDKSTLLYEALYPNNWFRYYAGTDIDKVVALYQQKLANLSIRVIGTSDPDTANTLNLQQANDKGTLENVLVVKFNAPKTFIMPSKVNNKTVTRWTDAAGTVSPVAGGKELTASTGGLTMVADAADYTISKLNSVAVLPDPIGGNTGVGAKLVGNAITLSGVVDALGQTITIPLNLETDGPDVKVSVSYNTQTGNATFTGLADTKGAILSIESNTVLQLALNNTRYTLDVRGINKKATELKLDGISANTGDTVVTINMPDSKMIKSVRETLGKALSKDKKVDFSKSPAVLQAFGASIASFNNNSQVQNWRTEAQRKAYPIQNSNKTTNDTSLLAGTGYHEVYAVLYLNVTITDYSVSNTSQGTLTATLTPYMRVEVRNSTDPTGVSTDPKTAPIVVRQGQALTNLNNSNMGTVTVNLPVGAKFAPDGYVHQDGTYAYTVAKKTAPATDGNEDAVFTLTHAGASNGLGTIVLNGTAPLISLTNTKSDARIKSGTYDKLQAAVEDVEQGGTITVQAAYTDTSPINVTGKAREFNVDMKSNAELKVSNTTGVTLSRPGGGTVYLVQLTKDNMIKPTTPTKKPIAISVASVTGGSASLSASSADEGDTITVTLTPATGYVSSGITVRTDKGTTVSVSGSGNRYSFVVPKGLDVKSITVTPAFTRVNTNATVTVSNPAVGGTAVTSAGSSQVAPGTTVTVTATPATGYRTMGLYVTNATATRTGANTFSFIVPSGVTNVVVTPRFDRNNGTLFEDVWSTDYFSNAVGWAVGRGITNGDGSVSRFGTSKRCTREDMVTFLWRNAGSPVVTDVRNPFWDVQVGSYYYNAVMWAVKNGITNGVSATQFGVGQPVTRAQAVTFLYRSAGSPAAGTNSGFYDVPSGEYYAKAVSWAVGKGITNGDGSTVKFSPNGYCLREQIVTFMYRNATGTRA